jgi:hypothetical protein
MAGLDEMLAAEEQGLADPAGGGGASQPGHSQAAEFVLPRRPYVPPAKEVYRIQGASMTVTGEGGERVYCQLEPAEGAAGGRKRWAAGLSACCFVVNECVCVCA